MASPWDHDTKSGKMVIVLFFPRFLLSVGLKTARAWDFRSRCQVETSKHKQECSNCNYAWVSNLYIPLTFFILGPATSLFWRHGLTSLRPDGFLPNRKCFLTSTKRWRNNDAHCVFFFFVRLFADGTRSWYGKKKR